MKSKLKKSFALSVKLSLSKKATNQCDLAALHFY